MHRRAHLLFLAHKFLEDAEIKNASCAEVLVEPVYFRSAFEELDEPPKVLKVEVVPLLCICLL